MYCAALTKKTHTSECFKWEMLKMLVHAHLLLPCNLSRILACRAYCIIGFVPGEKAVQNTFSVKEKSAMEMSQNQT